MTFRQRTATKAAKAIRDAGLPVAEVEIRPDGTVIVRTGQTGEAVAQEEPLDAGEKRYPRIDRDKARERIRALLVSQVARA